MIITIVLVLVLVLVVDWKEQHNVTMMMMFDDRSNVNE